MHLNLLRETSFFKEIGIFNTRNDLEGIILQTTTPTLPVNIIPEFLIGMERIRHLVSPERPIALILDVRRTNFHSLRSGHFQNLFQLGKVLNQTGHLLYPYLKGCTIVIGPELNQQLVKMLIHIVRHVHEIPCEVNVIVL